jgi:S-adenosyl-L-methionine hydrolase (adenosine-forming)
VVDLFADLPAGKPKSAAYLLAAYAPWFAPPIVFLAVVDPGVGSTRRAVVVEGDGRFYVGPENGLFELLLRRAGRDAVGKSSGGRQCFRRAFTGATFLPR